MHIDKSERAYIIGTLVLLTVFAAAVMISGFVYGIQVPEPFDKVDPRTVSTEDPRFNGEPEDRILELADNKYEIYMIAQMWKFSPGGMPPLGAGEPPISVPAGSTVTFYVTSKDIQHGFKIQDTNINMMVLPGEVSTLTATFDKPGVYNILCTEFCGANHHFMYGQITVTEN